ncbi:isocitrate lyase/PEP mutase family protein [Nocardia uniformis]|nr:isocitrate lyase/phosphoenolpyruvate mutase family protein [Nocardia uniformis]
MNGAVKSELLAWLHEKDIFVVGNSWDAESAGILTDLGFPALATSSAALAAALGRADGENQVTRAEALDNLAEIVAATPLPVTADLESGYGATPEEVAETIRRAAGIGVVGGSIEDASGERDNPIRDFEESVYRIAAAVEAARSLPYKFTLTARAENFLYGRTDLDGTIARLQAFEAVGADVLYAPGLPDAESVRAVCASVGRPVNVLARGPITRLSVEELRELGARRISVGGGLARLGTGWVDVATDIIEHGTFTGLR